MVYLMQLGCPGQDRRFLRPQDVFESDCPRCGTSIEFFKGDVTVRCHGCKRKIINPRFDPGCAAWCGYADQCLGSLAATYRQHPEFVRDRLETELRRARSEPEVVERALRTSRLALEEAIRSDGDPLVATAARLLCDLADEPAASAAAARSALAGLGIPAAVISQVERIIAGHDRESVNAKLFRQAGETAAPTPLGR
jgi:hypothetical protein